MRAAVVAAALAWLVLPAFAQAPRPPATQISGRIVANDTGEPLPYARVGLTAGVTGQGAVVRADGEGRFVLLSATPEGRVVASKAGYVQADPVAATAGQPLVIRLTPAAVIAGRAVDELGVPIVGAQIAIERRSEPDGTQTLGVAARTTTDDRGDYRVGGLTAGLFAISIVTLGNGFSGTTRNGITLPMPMAPRTYFPGVELPTEAAAVRVASGAARTGVDFLVPSGQSMNQPFSVFRMGTTGVLAIPGLQRPTLAAANGRAAASGRIVGTDGRPVAHAQVKLSLERNPLDWRSAVSDNDGRFLFDGLPAGTFHLTASKTGYSPLDGTGTVAAAAMLGGQSFQLADGEPRDRLDVVLARWGTISGRVFDEYGDMVQGASVQLLQVRYERGRRGLVGVDVETPLTNDLGAYRFYAVPPGQYVVRADVGSVRTADVGGYVPTYFPGTTAPAQSQFVALGVSQELNGIDIPLMPGRTARVTGMLTDAAGQPTTGGQLRLVPSQRSSATIGIAVGARNAGDGKFEFPNVPPGQYVIQAERGRTSPPNEGEFGAWPVVVGGADVTGLALQTSKGSSISGRVTFDSPAPGRRPRGGIELSPIGVDVDLSPSQVASVTAGADGTFAMTGINGTRRLDATRIPAGWTLKEIRVNGIDVTDRPLPFGRASQSLTGVEVVITDRVSEVVGVVTDDRGRPAPASVVLFAADRDRWYPSSRFLGMTTAAADGTFTVVGLPFGVYNAVAVRQLPTGQDAWQDPVYLDTLRFRAAAITVRDGQRITTTLRVP